MLRDQLKDVTQNPIKERKLQGNQTGQWVKMMLLEEEHKIKAHTKKKRNVFHLQQQTENYKTGMEVRQK